MYYPKSQVKVGLYTNGSEYIIKGTEEFYVGSYYKTSEGKKFAGQSPSINQNLIEIILPPKFADGEDYSDTSNKIRVAFYKSDPDPVLYDDNLNETTISNYHNLPKSSTDNDRFAPQPYTPTIQLDSQGNMLRFFAKKTNELYYLEINKDTYNKFLNNDPNSAIDLYEVATLVYAPDNSDSVFAQTHLIEKSREWYGFSQYILSITQT